jgi:subtilisin family serine protease
MQPRTPTLTVLFALTAATASAQFPAPPAPPEVEKSKEGQEADTNEILVFLKPGSDPRQYARDHGLRIKKQLKSDEDAYVFVASDKRHAKREKDAGPLGDPRVRKVHLNGQSKYQKRAFVPNDPYFNRNTPRTGEAGQWHLVNQIVPGRDARVQGAWNRDLTGQGVSIGIVDDGLQINHPDLSPNYSSALSRDFGGARDGDPSPVNSDDNHGTSVAGVAAARGGNGIGVTGAAPYATLAGLRVDFHTADTADFVDATLYKSSGTDTSIKIKNHSHGVSETYINDSAARSALATSAAAGTIHLFACGNERGTVGEDTNKQQLPNSPDCIAVAAFGSNGRFATYSSFGACVFVTAPSSTDYGYGITCTDRTGSAGYNNGTVFPDGNYTNDFGGTSSATPLAAGVMALVKQAQPKLNVRFAKHLLALTSTPVDTADAWPTSGGGWRTNKAGYKFNPNYGFGLINADELTK